MSLAPANSNGGALAHVFEGHEIRVQLDERGEPWFCAKDVCDALGVDRTHDLVRGLDSDERGAFIVRTPGGDQEMTHVSEPGLYALIARSRKPAAKRFDRWVRHDVLPSIFRTGEYVHPTRVKALPGNLAEVTEAAQSVLMRVGVRDGIAAAAMLAVIEQHTGIPMEAARRALPADTQPSDRLNPTKLGEELGISARAVNLRLAAAGLQTKGDRDPWMLTEAGKRYGEAVPYSNGKHAGNQLLWSRDVLEAIR